MARGCHGRFKKAGNKKLEGNNQGRKNLESTWLKRRKPTKGCGTK